MGLIAVEVAVEDLPFTPTLMWSGTPLFDAYDGIRLIDFCKINDIAILGIEGFKIKEERESQTWIVLSIFLHH